MNFKNVVLLLLYSFALFQGFQGEACDPKPMIMRHEGKKECVYLDTKGIKTIGVGFNMQNKEAPAVFASIGADYNKFISGPVTKWSAPCNCSTVPCLTEGQIEELLDISLKTAIADAQTVIPTFASLLSRAECDGRHVVHFWRTEICSVHNIFKACRTSILEGRR